jgi:hypothetical protein
MIRRMDKRWMDGRRMDESMDEGMDDRKDGWSVKKH